jgi:hypothetical protein
MTTDEAEKWMTKKPTYRISLEIQAQDRATAIKDMLGLIETLNQKDWPETVSGFGGGGGAQGAVYVGPSAADGQSA